MSVGGLVLDGFFNATARLGRFHPLSRPERHGVEVLADIPYLPESGLREHLLDVYRPTRTAHRARRYDGPPWPIVFYVHGGGFRILSKDTHWLMGLAFARRGFLVFNVGYRLAPRHPFPAAIDDVCRAYAWMTQHAAELGGDPSRVVLAGESAGANLVTSLALSLAYERREPFARAAFATGVVPKAVAAACGVFQVSDIDRIGRRKPTLSRTIVDYMRKMEREYLGRDPHGTLLDLADPVVALERGEAPSRPLPPFFLPVGTKDPLLPDTRRLATAVRGLGSVAEDRYYPGEMHAFHAFTMLPAARTCWNDTFAFLERFV